MVNRIAERENEQEAQPQPQIYGSPVNGHGIRGRGRGTGRGRGVSRGRRGEGGGRGRVSRGRGECGGRGVSRGRGRGNGPAANQRRTPVVQLPRQFSFARTNSPSPSPIQPVQVVPILPGIPATSTSNDDSSSQNSNNGPNDRESTIQIISPPTFFQNRNRILRKPNITKQNRRKSHEGQNEYYVAPPSIPKLSFKRLVQEIGKTFNTNIHFQSTSYDVLQEASEDYLTKLFSITDSIAQHSGRSTIMEKDLKFAWNLEKFLMKN